MSTGTQPPKFRTLDEVASELHKSQRWLRDWLRTYPGLTIPRVKAGRTMLFDDAAVMAIHEAMRQPRRHNMIWKTEQEATKFTLGSSEAVQEALALAMAGKRQGRKRPTK